MSAGPVEGEIGGGRSASFSEASGLLVVRDRSLFRPGFEGFCRRLAMVAVSLGGVRSGFVCLASGTFRLEFEGGRFAPAEMAEWFAEAVRAAARPTPDTASVAEKEPGGWVSLRVDAADQGGAAWETTLEGRGAFRLRHPSLVGRRDLARRIAQELAGNPGVASTGVTFWRGEIDLRFDREEICASEALAAAETARLRAVEPATEPARLEGLDGPRVATGLRRAGYLALAAGSFALTVFGLVIPGVPTVPFLLATSYFLVRSSPSLNQRLLRSRFFGPILADLEQGGGLRRSNKIKLVAFSLAIGVVTLALIAPTGPLLFVVLAVASLSLYAIGRIPSLPEIGETAGPMALAH